MLDKPGAGEMPSVFLSESESIKFVMKHEGSKKYPKIMPYIFVKITYPL